MTPRSTPRPSPGRWLAGALVLAALALGAGPARRAFVRQVVGLDGQVPMDMFLGTSSGTGLAPAARVRVVVLDGLGAAAAGELPALSAVCAAGQELRVDVGFPTVSLPVQAALWTGRTQQQSGLQYRAAQLEAPPAGSSAAQVEGSVALAESHPEIVRSFGFAATRPDPALDPADPEAWRAEFPEHAIAAVASPARLVHVHVLRVDEAGHAAGGASPAYAEAARTADELLGRLRAVAPTDALWFVLADHGHKPAGGHGGEEPEIRIVRACVAGPGIASSPAIASIHLVDLARALADALGVELPSDARGRRWSEARIDPAPGATLPRPGSLRGTIAALLVALGLLLGVLSDRSARAWRRVPWAVLAALLGVALAYGWPSLSDQPVFAPRGQQLWLACLPAGVLALGLGLAGQGARAQLAPALGLLAAALVLCRGFEVWLLPGLGLGAAGPPLMPRWTATVSVLFVVVRSVAEGAALAWLLRPLWTRMRTRSRGRGAHGRMGRGSSR